MDIATDTVVVRRERKTAVLSPDMLRALATAAVKNAIDPDGSTVFDAQDATVGEDGSVTVSLVIETEVPATATPTVAPAPVAAAAGAIPTTIG